jgi:hypothetical protein
VLLCVEAKLPAQGHYVTSERVERRLAAVLAADVAGYSRLMGRDEEGTLAALKSFRKSLVDPAITAHRGRIVKTTGDGMPVEFASAVDAARCALEVQRDMAARNGAVPQDTRIEFCIGNLCRRYHHRRRYLRRRRQYRGSPRRHCGARRGSGLSSFAATLHALRPKPRPLAPPGFRQAERHRSLMAILALRS